ncbi:MAG: VanZ family protein [Clostridium sp.]|nr:VanZ family protein [Clostridium sp.]
MIVKYIRKYPLSLFTVGVVWFLSLFTPPKIDIGEIAFFDKWAHFVMYGGLCSVIWGEYWRSHAVPHPGRLFLWAVVAPVVMSGVIELVQEYGTENRTGDWLDLAANSVGVVLGAVIGRGLLKRYFRPSGH